MKPSANTLDWLQNTFEGHRHVEDMRERRKWRNKSRKAYAAKARIDAAHAYVENWLDAMHRHEDPFGVWARENDTRHDYLETAD